MVRISLKLSAALCMAALLVAGLATEAQATPVLEFDGDEDYVSIPHDASLDPNIPFAVEAWIYSDFPHQGAIFGKGTTDNGTGGFDLRIQEGGTSINLVKYFIVDQWVDFPEPLAPNEWHHIAAVQLSDRIQYFHNGELIGEFSHSGPLQMNEAIATIGRGREGNYPFDGRIADVRFWSNARTQADIQQFMNQRLEGDEFGLAGYWPLTESDGGTAFDGSPNGNDGTLNGPAWVDVDDLVLAPAGGYFLQDLQSRIVSAGQNITLGPVTLREPEGDVTYEWFFNGAVIDGETGDSLTFSPVTFDDEGEYHVVVSDDSEESPFESNRAQLSVWERVPAAGVLGLLMAGGLLVGAGAWGLRKARR